MTMSRKELIWSAIITGAFGQLVAWVLLDSPTTWDRVWVSTAGALFAGVVWACVSLLIKAER